MNSIKITTLKSQNPYTEICNILQIENYYFLLDAGKEWSKSIINPAEIFTILISHAHIEHIKGLLSLLNLGYKNKIFTTSGTKILLPLILEEYLKSNFAFKENFIKKLIDKITDKIFSLDFGKVFSINEKIDIRFKPAYHTFGSSFIEIDLREKTKISTKIVYSGDLGATETPLLLSPKSPWRADILILETANSNLIYPEPSKRKEILKKFLDENKIIVIPEYSIGRVEEIIYEINRISPETKIIFDTPIADKVEKYYTSTIKNFKEEILLKLQKKGLKFKNLEFISTEKEHKKFLQNLNSIKNSVIITPPPSLTTGRSSDYLKYKDMITFIGLTPAYLNSYPFINYLPFYSSHADKRNLVNFLKRIRFKPQKIVLFHSNENLISSFQEEIKNFLTLYTILS